MAHDHVLGIDIGGTGIKGAVVDVHKGQFHSERNRIETPHPATVDAVASVVADITRHFAYEGHIGVTFPGVITHGVVKTAANLDPSWIDADASAVFGDATGCPVTVLNDADAAGIAEQAHGAAHALDGVVMLLTLGTGIGSALLYHGELVPNTELGHLELHGGDAEKYFAESVREHEQLGWEEWAGRLSEYLQMVEALFWPDLFIIGGGISKQPDPWVPHLRCRTPVVMAEMKNKAGIVGAAIQAHRHGGRTVEKHKGQK